MPNLIWLEWERAAEYAIEPGPDGEPWLKPKSNERLIYNPLEREPYLFLEFADLDGTPESFLGFARKYGEIHHTNRQGEPVALWETARSSLKLLPRFGELLLSKISESPSEILTKELREPIEMGELKIVMLPSQSGDGPAVRFGLTPNDLYDGMWLQYVLAATSNTQLRSCAWCGTWFAYGTGTGRRKSAHYCSDRCRKAAHRSRKEGQ